MKNSMKLIDVTNVIVSGDKVVCALFDGRYDAIAIITIKTEDDGVPHLVSTDPQGAEKLFWLDRFGLLTVGELAAEAEKLERNERLQLYEKLKLEFE